MRRSGQRSIRAAIDAVDDFDYILPTSHLVVRILVGLLLIPFCIITTMALFTVGQSEHFANEMVTSGQVLANERSNALWFALLRTKEFLWFAIGVVLTAGWFWTRWLETPFLYLYVLGHELTHVIFVYLCLGKVSGFNVKLEGGYVITNKTNVLIALSPYFVPFWSVVVLAISALLGAFWTIPYHQEAIYFLIGGTWLFHLLWTLWMIPRDQPDLKENGTFFSLVIIYLANVLVLAAILCAVPGGLTWKGFFYHWMDLFLKLVAFMVQVF